MASTRRSAVAVAVVTATAVGSGLASNFADAPTFAQLAFVSLSIILTIGLTYHQERSSFASGANSASKKVLM